MKKQLVKLGMAITLLLLAANSMAGWSGNLTVSHIYGGENITVYFNEATPNPANCSQGPLKVASWSGSSPEAKNFMSMMLAAKMGNRLNLPQFDAHSKNGTIIPEECSDEKENKNRI